MRGRTITGPNGSGKSTLLAVLLGRLPVTDGSASLGSGVAVGEVDQARGVNLLVLDEPTNHLDPPAIEQREQALDSYDGTLLLLTHDRRLLDAVHVTRRIAVDAGQVHVDT